MKNYKMLIQYDGSRYKGWQVQNSTDMTIQGKLQSVLTAMVGDPVEVIGSGRTDSGVHALGQVANCHIPDGYTSEEIHRYLNRYLPNDIAVLSVEEVDERFHARYHATGKTYLYRIHRSEIPNVFERKYLYTFLESLDLDAMTKACAYLVGTHDFASFCSNKKMKKSTIRTITDITITEKDSELVISYTGDGFLQNMIRILTGTLLEIGIGRRAPEDISKILELKSRPDAGFTVPPEGLVLKEVYYS